MIPAIAADGSLFPMEKLRAHREGVLHLAVSVFVFDEKGRLLLQQRAAEKYHSPGQWANTCCTHPHWEEDLHACASRRLEEELGFVTPLLRGQNIEYRASVGGGLVEHERVTMFTGSINGRTQAIEPAPGEVAATRWLSRDELRREIQETPDAFTPWLRIYVDRFPDLDFDRRRRRSYCG